MPNILIIGTGTGGSWEIRGTQIGAALGARVTSRPNVSDWRWADVAILVKRAIYDHGDAARKANLPVVWDALDFWDQPEENAKPLAAHIQQVRSLRQRYGLAEVIAATKQMAQDVDGYYIPHHHRPGLEICEPRERAEIVAYEGTRKYLGRWFDATLQACAERGLKFAVNPESLNVADVVMAFRDGKWDGEVCRRWKSGVKYVNALAACAPVITQPCAAVDEIAPYHYEVEHPDQLGAALDAMVMVRDSAMSLASISASTYAIENVAKQYRALASSVLKVAA